MERQIASADRVPEAVLSAAQEPATPIALWPTFMRRTLAEELLRRVPEEPARA